MEKHTITGKQYSEEEQRVLSLDLQKQGITGREFYCHVISTEQDYYCAYKDRDVWREFDNLIAEDVFRESLRTRPLLQHIIVNWSDEDKDALQGKTVGEFLREFPEYAILDEMGL